MKPDEGEEGQFVNLLFEHVQLSPKIFLLLSITYILIALTSTSLSIWVFVRTYETFEIRQQYYTGGTNLFGPKNFTFEVGEDVLPPIYLMYELESFYQNYRKYSLSKSTDQLAGNNISLAEATDHCAPYVTNADCGRNTSFDGYALDPQAVCNPCGIIAQSVFNDVFQLASSSAPVFINETGITWGNDIGITFVTGAVGTQWVDPENEHFVVWLRTAATTNFLKLWGRIDTPLPRGVYTLTVQMNYAFALSSNRFFVLSTAGPLVGRNYVLPGALLLFGLLTAATAVAYFFKFKEYQVPLV